MPTVLSTADSRNFPRRGRFSSLSGSLLDRRERRSPRSRAPPHNGRHWLNVPATIRTPNTTACSGKCLRTSIALLVVVYGRAVRKLATAGVHHTPPPPESIVSKMSSASFRRVHHIRRIPKHPGFSLKKSPGHSRSEIHCCCRPSSTGIAHFFLDGSL